MTTIMTEAERVEFLFKLAEEATRNAHEAVRTFHAAAIAAHPIKINTYIVSSRGDIARVDGANVDTHGVVHHIMRLRDENGEYSRPVFDRYRACWREPESFPDEAGALKRSQEIIQEIRVYRKRHLLNGR